MAGQLALRAPHLDDHTPAGSWFDAGWALYCEFATSHTAEQLDALDELWDGLHKPDLHGADRPTAETWGTSDEAQASMHALMAQLSAAGAGGPADGGA